MDFESKFLVEYAILKLDELTSLNNNRKSVDKKITEKVVTEDELVSQFKEELCLLHTCKLKIHDLMESLDVIETHILDLLCNRIINLCRHMHELFSIPKEVLSVCINACRDNVIYIKAELLNFLVKAVMRIGDNEHTIWIQLLELYLEIGDGPEVVNVFQEGVRSLKANSLPLFKTLIKHWRNKRPDMILSTLTKYSSLPYENVSSKIRPKCLKWCLKIDGIDSTRKLFNELKDLQPPCCKLYLKMINIESERPDFELDTVRKMFDDACTLFGRNNIGVWIDYCRFEFTKGSMVHKRKICNKAVFTLEYDLKDTFVDEYYAMQREIRMQRLLRHDFIIIDGDADT
ncbi:uncharacterized protein LOC111038091 [Myzus persicae]|uniref:uncharacterized protein LOC111038091 n=1 Tax=Myzus persicae TaxID=13164 RepID=UPI000B932EED|nr:uncharacterized protein LOC111038091 [Myzus persicae]